MVNLDSFLKFGYFLDYSNPRVGFEFGDIERDKYSQASRQELVSLAIELWRSSVSNSFDAKEKHLVPLSGGLDSRAILATLLEHTDASSIYTYTFGTPGTRDYEIGNYVAKKVGTKHSSFPLTKYKYSLEDEISLSQRTDHQTFLFHHPDLSILDEQFSGFKVWSGYILDVMAGSHLPTQKSTTVIDAKHKALCSEAFVRSIDLCSGDPNDLVRSFSGDFVDSSILSFEEQIEYKNRLVKYIEPNILYQGFNYICPVLNKELFRFFHSIPDCFRRDQLLYKDMLLFAYKDLFSLRTKTNFGLPLGYGKSMVEAKKFLDRVQRKLGINRNQEVNYLDFNKAIREKKDLQIIISSSIQDLKKRDLLDSTNFDKIFFDHVSGRKNYADALIVLASLEIQP